MTVATQLWPPELLQIQNHIREKVGLDPLPDPETQLHCSDCGKWKNDEEFYVKSGERAEKRRGRREHCKTCDNLRRRRWSKTNLERERKTWRIKKHERRLKSGVHLPYECECKLRFSTKSGLGNHKRVCELRDDFLSKCACGRVFTTRGLPAHQRSCKKWLDRQ